jgi:hypothetical protein
VKLISTEIDAKSVQLTYTDGPAAPEAAKLLIVRMPLDEVSEGKSLRWNRLRILGILADEIEAERRKLDEEIRKDL